MSWKKQFNEFVSENLRNEKKAGDLHDKINVVEILERLENTTFRSVKQTVERIKCDLNNRGNFYAAQILLTEMERYEDYGFNFLFCLYEKNNNLLDKLLVNHHRLKQPLNVKSEKERRFLEDVLGWQWKAIALPTHPDEEKYEMPDVIYHNDKKKYKDDPPPYSQIGPHSPQNIGEETVVKLPQAKVTCEPSLARERSNLQNLTTNVASKPTLKNDQNFKKSSKVSSEDKNGSFFKTQNYSCVLTSSNDNTNALIQENESDDLQISEKTTMDRLVQEGDNQELSHNMQIHETASTRKLNNIITAADYPPTRFSYAMLSTLAIAFLYSVIKKRFDS